jgi:hypothetical protein
MAIEQLSGEAIEQRIGTQHEQTGIEYPSRGLQPYYEWLIRTLHLLAESSAAALRVARDEQSATMIRILPGRASIDGTALAYAGGTQELGSFNNDTAYVALIETSGQPAIDVRTASNGWPSAAHIKLAEVTLDGGAITAVVDRRFETMLKV